MLGYWNRKGSERDGYSFGYNGTKTPTATGCPMAVNCFIIYGAERGT